MWNACTTTGGIFFFSEFAKKFTSTKNFTSTSGRKPTQKDKQNTCIVALLYQHDQSSLCFFPTSLDSNWLGVFNKFSSEISEVEVGSNCGRKSGVPGFWSIGFRGEAHIFFFSGWFSASSAKWALKPVIGEVIVRSYNSAFRGYTVVIQRLYRSYTVVIW